MAKPTVRSIAILAYVTILAASTYILSLQALSKATILLILHVAVLPLARSPLIPLFSIIQTATINLNHKQYTTLSFYIESVTSASIDTFINIIAAIAILIINYKFKLDDPILSTAKYLLSRSTICNVDTAKIMALSTVMSMVLFLEAKYSTTAINNVYFSAIVLTPSIILAVLAISLLDQPLTYISAILLFILATYMPHIPLTLLATIDPLEVELANIMGKRRKAVEIGQIVGYIPPHMVRYSKLKLIGLEHTYTPLSRNITYRMELETPKHILVTGMTGYGKSSTTGKIAANIANKIPNTKILIVDPHGEYESIIQKYLHNQRKIYVLNAMQTPLNPLDNMGLNPLERIAEIVALFKKLFRLGPIQSEILINAIKEAYEVKGIKIEDPRTWRREPPTIADLIRILRTYVRVEPRATTLLSHIEALWDPALYSRTTNLLPLLEDPYHNIIIVDLHEIPTKGQQSLYITTLLRHIYNYAKHSGKTNSIRLVVIVDEAHLIASSKEEEDVLASYTAELRKYGVALTIVIQNPENLSRTTLSNIAVKIVFRIAEPRTVSYMADYILGGELSDTIKYTVQTLKRGYAIVSEDSLPLPIIVKTL